jgi:hypothetical protein
MELLREKCLRRKWYGVVVDVGGVLVVDVKSVRYSLVSCE